MKQVAGKVFGLIEFPIQLNSAFMLHSVSI